MLGLESFLIMTKRLILAFLLSLILPLLAAQTTSAVLRSKHILPAAPGARGGQLQLTGFFVEVDGKRIDLPELSVKSETRLADGRLVRLSTKRDGDNFTVSLTARPTERVSKWGLAIEAGPQEYFTGVMERVIDGPRSEEHTSELQSRGHLVCR